MQSNTIKTNLSPCTELSYLHVIQQMHLQTKEAAVFSLTSPLGQRYAKRTMPQIRTDVANGFYIDAHGSRLADFASVSHDQMNHPSL